MPEMIFTIRWPDDTQARCVSPSRAIAAFLQPGQRYALPEFLKRSRDGLNAASERVRQVHGRPCSQAAAQLAAIERAANRFGTDEFVLVEAIDLL